MAIWLILSNLIAAVAKFPAVRQCVVMFHPGRCGSTVLGDLLGQHPLIEWAGEYYHRDQDSDYYVGRQSPLNLYRRIARAKNPIFGFEVKYSHGGQMRLIGMDWNRYVRQLSRWGCKHFILLRRRNILRNIVSIAASLSRKRWHQSVHEQANLARVFLDVNRVQTALGDKPLLETLERHYQADEEISRVLSGLPLLRLYYEDHIAQDPREGYRSVCNYLGVEPQENASVSFGPTNPFPLQEIIINFEEVARELTGTPFAWMLSG